MSITINEFTGVIDRVQAGYAGSAALAQFNTPIGQIEDCLNVLATRIANINSKSAVVRKYVPLSGDVFVGALVYYNKEEGHSRFEPALAALLGEPGAQGNSVEAPSARVEGMVLSVDSGPDGTDTVMGTLLVGGYWESAAAMSGCLGTSAGTPGTYYLSPYSAGHAVSDTNGHLRQPVLSNYGDGKFSMSLFYMAHDNHFHASCELSGVWEPVSLMLPPDVAEAPEGAVFWYDGSGDPEYINIGELSERTTAVFYGGVLQRTVDAFVVADGYLWYKGLQAPGAGTVTLFNTYPFAYDSAVVRSVESANDALTVVNRNGLIILKANDFVSGSAARNSYAVSAISGNTVMMTPVVSGLGAGPGISLAPNTDGSVIVSSSSRIGVPVDAYTVNYNQANSTSDGVYTYFTFPKGRNSSITISIPVSDVAPGTVMQAFAWCCGVGSGGSFNVSFYWVPQPDATTQSALPSDATASSTLTFSGAENNTVTYSETPGYATITGPGTLFANVSVASAPTDDVRMLRVGFRLEVVSAAVATQSTTDVTSINAVMNTATAGATLAKYSCVRVANGTLALCRSAQAGDSNQCVGITIESANSGSDVRYLIQGVIQDTSLSFTPGGAVFISPSGTWTQTDPSSDSSAAFIQRIGTALTANIVQVSIEPGILKSNTI